jgi:hypothetical protein
MRKMGKKLILASAGIVLAFLVISVIAKEIELTISPITIDAKQILEEVKKKNGSKCHTSTSERRNNK